MKPTPLSGPLSLWWAKGPPRSSGNVCNVRQNRKDQLDQDFLPVWVNFQTP
jgi:hypothetical protein